MANEGFITLSDLQTKFNAAGVYTVYRDNTASPNVRSTPIFRLVAGFSKIGLPNVPVYIEQNDYTTAEKIYGKLDKSLERKKSFFHREIQQALSDGPVLALNLLKTNNDCLNGIPTVDADVVPYRSFSVDIANTNGDNVDKLFASFYDKERFWKASPAYLLATRKVTDQGSILNLVNLSQTPISFIIRKSNVKGFDVTVFDWYTNAGIDIPPYLNKYDLISDYFVDVVAIAGNFGPDRYSQLAIDPIFGNYFDVNGLIANQLDTFLARKEVNVINIFTGCLIPNFKDQNNTNQYIESIINRTTSATGILCAVDRDELDMYEDGTNTRFIDLVGHRLLTNDVNATNFLSYKKNIKDDMVYTKKSTNTTVIAGGIENVYAVSQGSHKFTFAGDLTSYATVEGSLQIIGSTGNDSVYTIYSKELVDGRTEIVVTEDISSDVADGVGLLGTVITKDPTHQKLMVRIVATNPDFDTLTADLVLGTLIYGVTTNAGYNSGITVTNPVLKITRIVKTETQITFDITSPLKDAENSVSGSFVDIAFGSGYTYETTNDIITYDGTQSYLIAEPGSQIYKDLRSGILTNGDSITHLPDGPYGFGSIGGQNLGDGVEVVQYIKGVFTNADDDYREIVKIELYTDSDLTIPIEEGDGIDFGASYDAKGYAVIDPTKLDIVSMAGTNSERFDATIISAKVARLDISLEPQVKIGQYLVGKDDNDDLMLTRIVSVKRVLVDSIPTSIDVETANIIKPYVSTGGGTQVERYLPLKSFYDHFDLTYLKGFTLKTTHMPNGTNARMKEIYSVMTDTNMRSALIDPEMIDFRYFVDTFNHGLENQSKRYLSKLIMDRQRCLGILNAPTKEEFVNSQSPRFTNTPSASDPLPTLNVSFIAQGGNLDESPDFLYTLPEEEDGASYVGFFFPNIIITDDDGGEVSSPLAALVSNKFMQKYNGGNPFMPVAGPRRGVLNGNGLSRMEYDLDRPDRGLLEQKGINPVYQKRNGDFQIMGNETAYKKFSSSLNNLNVRDMLVTFTIDQENILSNYLFEYNDDLIRTEVKNLLDNYYLPIQNAYRAILSYDLIFDRNNNPSWVLRENAAIVDVIIEPADVAKKFIGRITLIKSGSPVVGSFVAI